MSRNNAARDDAAALNRPIGERAMRHSYIASAQVCFNGDIPRLLKATTSEQVSRQGDLMT